MWFLGFLLLASSALAQSFGPGSVLVYTSDSSTYFVTDVGTTALGASPTFCPNVSTSVLTSTVYEPRSTVTIQQPSSAQQTTGAYSVLTNNGFENGTSSPFNSSASSSSVSAEVVQSGPYQPRTGDNYLLITFNDTVPAAQRPVRRQSSSTATPLWYNVTQTFTASSGTLYTLTAFAAEVGSGSDDPQCSITICGDNACGPSYALTTSYSQYSFLYRSPTDESSAVATLQLECLGSGYVALDDVSVTSDTSSSTSSQSVSTKTTTVYRTQVVVQSQTYTQIETTTFVSGSEVVLTTLVPTVVYTTINHPTTEVAIVSTVQRSTALATTAFSEYVNVTVSSVSTLTTILTRTLNSTVLSYQPSIVVLTEYATSTAVFTATLPDQSASIVYIDPSTAYVTLSPSIVVVTLQQPVVTITPDPVTQVSTLDAQTSMLISDFELTDTVYTTLPQETTYFTTDPLTEQVTVTLPRDTTTSTISVTPPPLTETVTILATLPAETQTAIQSLTLPAVTQTIEVDEYLSDITETLIATQTLIDIVAGPTITQTYSPPFVLRIVGGDYDGNYLYTRPSPYEETKTLITIGSGDFLAAAIFSIDPDSGTLSTSYASYGIQSGSEGRSLIVSSDQYTLQMTCADVGGYLSCAGDGFTVFSAEGYAYLETPDYQTAQSPSYVGVTYQILYLPLATAATTSSAAAASSVTATTCVPIAPYQTPGETFLPGNPCLTTYSDPVNPLDRSYNILCNVDYPGGDLSIGSEYDFQSCIDLCSSLPDCKALVYNGNTCYIKNVVNPPSGSSVDGTNGIGYYSALRLNNCEDTSRSVCNTAYEDTSVAPAIDYSISCTIDYPHDNIRRLMTNSLIACIQYCSTYSECEASIWVEQGQDEQWCYLKDADTVAQPLPFPDSIIAYSATRSPAAAPVCGSAYRDTSVSPSDDYSISCTVNYGGSSIETLVTDTLIDCIQYCSSIEPCVAVVWVEQGQGYPYCYLKDANAATQLANIPFGFVIYSATYDPGAHGAAADPTTSAACGTSYQDTSVSPSDGYSISCTTNYGGSSIRTLVTNTLIECIQYCSSTELCVAVVWVQQGQGFPYCYLKDANAASQIAEYPSGFSLYTATRDQQLQ